jgi:peptidoglycan/xylan/chitin deacetylase (PgdA/CDA1 family)
MTSAINGPQRDFVGYGRHVPVVHWPGGARVAVSLVLNYEEGSERSFAFGDQANESLGELPRAIAPGHRDLATESVYEYGSRAGVFRLLRLFERFQVPCTLFASAVALEQNREVADAVRELGFEVCGHGWRWSEDWTVPREEEAERIDRAVASITATCGRRPVGWYSRWMPSADTRELLVAEGGFLYDSNAYNDDLPYYVPVGERQHLVIPYSLTYNDARYITGATGSPAEFLDYCRRGLDYLWEEGAETPKMLSVGLHARLSGQAARASVVREFIDYALNKGRVWFAKREEIAHSWIAQFPPGSASNARRIE